MESHDSILLTANQIIDTVKQIVSRISRIDVEEFEDNVKIREELGIDSLMAMEILATCEKHLKIKIDESKFVDIETVGDFLNLTVDLYRRAHG